MTLNRASSTSATTVINVTTDVVQIQDNGNDLEEEGGNYFRATATAAMTVTTTATAMAATAARPVAAMVAATAAATAATTQPRKRGRPTKARPPEGLKGQRAQEEEAEGYWWWW
ncbi:hypothetical protein V8E54_007471 [Elaphomyces granulatus]